MARKIEVEVVGDTKSIEAAFKRTSKAGRSLESDLLRVGKRAAIGVAALGTAAGAASFKLVKMAGDAEEVRSKFQVTFQQEMPRMVKQLDAFSAATGASRFELRQQAADLGALLVPLTNTRREAADLSVGFVKLATDLSSFNNVPVEEALLAIRSGLVGEAEPLRRFGVLLNEAAVKAEAYRSGIAKSGAALTEQQKVQARANLIMQQTTLAQGDAARTSDSFANQMRRLQNQVSDTATELGLKLLPIATLVVTKLNEWGPAIAERVRPQLDALGRWADEHKQEFKDLFENIVTGAQEAGTQLRGMAGGADRVVTSMGGWDDAFSMILSGLLANKFIAVGKSIGGPGGMLPLLTRVKALGPTIAVAVVIDLILNENHRKALAGLAKLAADKVGLNDPRWIPLLGLFSSGPTPTASPATTSARGTVVDPRGRTVGTTSPAGAGAAGLQLPTSFSTTHQTAGLAGFPAVDIFAKPGTPVLAPEDGSIVSIRPFNNNPDFYGMAIYYAGASGSMYYIKHIYDPAPIGRYKKGAKIGRVAAGTSGGPHVHLGKRTGPGVPVPISDAGGVTAASTGATTPRTTGSTGGTTSGGTRPKTTAELIPGRLRLALVRAEGTPGLGNDLAALQAIAAYLQKILPKTKDIEKRIEITEALNSVRARITEITKDQAAKKKLDAAELIDFENMKKQLREKFREGIEQARQTIQNARGAFTGAFGTLTDSLLQVFDAKTQQMLENLRADIVTTSGTFAIGIGDETPTERLLRERREAKIDADLAAQRARATTAEDIAAAEEAIYERSLEKQAAAERKAADEWIAREKDRILGVREEQKIGFQQALLDLQNQWTKTNATSEQRTKQLKELMAKYDTPFESVGDLLGASFAAGFLGQLQAVFDRLADLSRELNKITPAQAAEAVILAGGTALQARSAALNAKYGLGSLPTFQKGGLVPGTGPQLAIVHGGETVVPRGGAAGGVTVNVYGDVTGTELVETVRREINRINRQNGRQVAV